jgi:hypothetical protein
LLSGDLASLRFLFAFLKVGERNRDVSSTEGHTGVEPFKPLYFFTQICGHSIGQFSTVLTWTTGLTML